MPIIEGQYVSDSAVNILNVMLEDARNQFDEELNSGQLSVLRSFYIPIATRLAETQNDIGLVLSSSQIDYAEGQALDYITALINVPRKQAFKAEGSVIFSRSSSASIDYIVPSGTTVMTNATDGVRFKTDESVVLEAGETEVSASITAQKSGVDANVAANTITLMPSPPQGIEEVINPEETSGGSEAESDNDLRERAKSELSEGSSSTPSAIVSAVTALQGVKGVSIFVNEESTSQNGMPPHSFELVVEGGDDNEIGQTLLDKKAAGTRTSDGVFGTSVTTTATLVNGQEFDVGFSRPEVLNLHVDLTIDVTDEYAGDSAVLDAIVRYTGGTLISGNTIEGEIGVGDDIIATKLKHAIMSVIGIHDITELRFSVNAPPTSSDTENIDVLDNQTGQSDALGQNMSITTNNI